MTDQENKPKLTPPLPKPDLISLGRMLFMQGMISAGKIPSPVTNKYETDPNIAKFQVEMFELLMEKTAGNRTNEEDQAMEEMVHTLRMAYVDVAKK
jgi:hypothetical protein